jgi:hypothetical protein
VTRQLRIVELQRDVELRARRAHKQWMAELMALGFMYGPQRRGYSEPDLVPWKRLPIARRAELRQAALASLETDSVSRLYGWTVEHRTRALDWLSRLLPAYERERFVAEQLGNLGICDHWRQHVAWLIGLVLGMPRLAWMMHRENRRGRAE